MLGRKIIEVYPDENAPEPDTTSIGKDNNSLPVRRLRSAGLRIITENDVTNVNYLQVSWALNACLLRGSHSATTPRYLMLEDDEIQVIQGGRLYC